MRTVFRFISFVYLDSFRYSFIELIRSLISFVFSSTFFGSIPAISNTLTCVELGLGSNFIISPPSSKNFSTGIPRLITDFTISLLISSSWFFFTSFSFSFGNRRTIRLGSGSFRLQVEDNRSILLSLEDRVWNHSLPHRSDDRNNSYFPA